jgi:uncharacterized protein
MDIDHEVVPSESPCNGSMRYRSAIGFGRAEFIEDREVKQRALCIISAHDGCAVTRFSPPLLELVTVIRLKIDRITARISGY